jgi:hypothetical protein
VEKHPVDAFRSCIEPLAPGGHGGHNAIHPGEALDRIVRGRDLPGTPPAFRMGQGLPELLHADTPVANDTEDGDAQHAR